MLEWTKLLSSKRQRESNSDVSDPLIVRNAFEADYDRIVGSSSVRRLQDKAQVFPLQELFNDINQKAIDLRMDQKEQDIAASRNFRNFVQGFLFREAISSFISNYEAIMSNQSSDGFELLSSQHELIHELKSATARNCFNCREVLSLELSGRQVINGLLDIFVPALIENDGETLSDSKTYPGKLFKLISQNFTFIALHDQKRVTPDLKPDGRSLSELINNLSVYGRLQLITDFRIRCFQGI